MPLKSGNSNAAFEENIMTVLIPSNTLPRENIPMLKQETMIRLKNVIY